jgi:DnaJ-class molecular chaperone
MTNEHPEPCLRCGGTGAIQVDNATPVTTVIGMVPCPHCGGSGKVYCSESIISPQMKEKP